MNRRMVIALVVLVAIQAVALVIYQWKRPSTVEEFAVDKLAPTAAPELAYERADGSRGSLADARGTIVMVHFWATWCEPCRSELPGLLALAKERDLAFVAVSIDDTWDEIRTFFGGTVPASVVRPVVEGVHHRFGASTMPDTYIVDPAGRLVLQYAGARDWSTARARSSLASAISSAGSERP